MFTVSYGTAVKKDLKKLSRKVLKEVDGAFSKIAEDPYSSGERLIGSLSAFYSYHMRVSKVDYRIIYEILPSDQIVLVLIIDTRENMYDKLRRRV